MATVLSLNSCLPVVSSYEIADRLLGHDMTLPCTVYLYCFAHTSVGAAEK